MIYDVFPFFNELDLLDLRLRELGGVVDKFVISECDTTFSGRRKPLWYEENKHRFKWWHHKIVHQKITGRIIDTPNPWDRERAYRDAIREAFEPKPGDIITYTDADEIPRPTVYQRFNLADGVNVLDMMQFCYYLNGRIYKAWRFAKICSGEFWNACGSLHELRFVGVTTTMRDYSHKMALGGWHFTWLGSRTLRMLKSNSTSHCNDKGISNFQRRLGLSTPPSFGPGEKAVPVKIDARWPRTVQIDLAKYKALGWIYEP